jgi:hypothetical protein
LTRYTTQLQICSKQDITHGIIKDVRHKNMTQKKRRSPPSAARTHIRTQSIKVSQYMTGLKEGQARPVEPSSTGQTKAFKYMRPYEDGTLNSH